MNNKPYDFCDKIDLTYTSFFCSLGFPLALNGQHEYLESKVENDTIFFKYVLVECSIYS